MTAFRIPRIPRRLLVVAVIVGPIIGLAVGRFALAVERDRAQAHLARRVAGAASAIESEMRADLEILYSMKSLFEAGVPVTINRVGSMMTTFFTAGPVTDYASAAKCDTERYGKMFHGMLSRGVHLAPSQFEAAFVSTVHTDADIDATIEAARTTLNEL